MQIMAENCPRTSGPKQREQHHSYNETVDEPAKLIDNEAVEIEREVPAEDNEPIERIAGENASKPTAFEEG